jgi:DNA-binding response OmpR family regulator
MLPDINAGVVCKTIRSNPSLANTQILLISGIIEEEKVRDLYALGVKAFLHKPFRIDDLVAKIAELLNV